MNNQDQFQQVLQVLAGNKEFKVGLERETLIMIGVVIFIAMLFSTLLANLIAARLS